MHAGGILFWTFYKKTIGIKMFQKRKPRIDWMDL